MHNSYMLFPNRKLPKLLHWWEDRRLHVRACGVATAIERTDLSIHAPWESEAVAPHDEVNFCTESVSGFQSVAHLDINA